MSDVKDQDNFGSGSYSTPVYLVEAKSTHGEIVLRLDGNGSPLGNLILTPHEWKRIPIEYGPVGVPNRLDFYAEAREHRFMTYACAMAIASWLQATRDYGGIVTRLVQIQFKSEYSTKCVGRSEPMDLHEDALVLLRKLRGDKQPSVDAVGEALTEPVADPAR